MQCHFWLILDTYVVLLQQRKSIYKAPEEQSGVLADVQSDFSLEMTQNSILHSMHV